MKEKVLNSMVIAAMAKICENRCKDREGCNTNCDEQQYLFDMIFRYPVIELELGDEEVEE